MTRRGEEGLVALDRCPHCFKAFEPFLRGMVVRSGSWWWLFYRPTVPMLALICRACKDIVGYEWEPIGAPVNSDPVRRRPTTPPARRWRK